MQPTDSVTGFFGIKAVSKDSLLNFSPGIAQRAGSVLLYFAMIRYRGSNVIESCQLLYTNGSRSRDDPFLAINV